MVGVISFYCYGPPKSPMEMTINEMNAWMAHTQTPVIFNHHEPYVVNDSSIINVDLNGIQSTRAAKENKERVLIN